jgi:hypothetical protein
MLRFIYILLLYVSLVSCEKEKKEPNNNDTNKWAKYFEETKPETHTYISSLELYDENTVIFSTMEYMDKNPLYIVRDDSLIAIDTSNPQKQLPDLKLFYSAIDKKIWCNDNAIICYSPKSKNYMYWRIGSTIGKNSSFLKKDKNGAIWEATYYDGLLKYTNYSCTQYFNGSLFGEICMDKEKNLYISSLPPYSNEKGVLIKYNYSTWDTIYTCSNNSYWVAAMSFDNSNNLWFGVLSRSTIGVEYGGGIIMYDGNNFVEYSISNSGLTSNSVVELCIDKFDNLWVGTYDGGICKFQNDGTWLNYTFENDIQLSQSFEHIVIDSSLNIWSSIHFIGLIRFKE